MSNKIQELWDTFFVSNESCGFRFDGFSLQWRDQIVPVWTMVMVGYVHAGNCCESDKKKIFQFRKSQHKCKGHDTIVIRYAATEGKNRLRVKSIKFQGDGEKLTVWLEHLRAALARVSMDRPKKYLVFINPSSGRQNGIEVYMRKVKPLFDLAQIDAFVVVTKSSGDYEKVICSGIDCYDAILGVGGDGTVSDIINALISYHISSDDPTRVPKIVTPIGIIPCGTSDSVAYTLNGTRDTETNALFSILGTRKQCDVCRVVSESGQRRFFVSAFTYGHLSDLIGESEKFRWIGPVRFNYAGLLTLMRSKEYYGTLDMIGERCPRKTSSLSLVPRRSIPLITLPQCLSVATLPLKEPLVTDYENEPPCGEVALVTPSRPETVRPDDSEVTGGEIALIALGASETTTEPSPLQNNIPMLADSETCHGDQITVMYRPDPDPVENEEPEQRPELNRLNISGRYFFIACANISCSTELTPNGLAPRCVPGDGRMNVVLFQPSTLCDLYKIYTRLTSKDRRSLVTDLPSVTVYSTKEVKITVSQKNETKPYTANCDGELFHDSAVTVKLFEDIIQFFARADNY